MHLHNLILKITKLFQLSVRVRDRACARACVCASVYVEYCNNVMGSHESYSMWNQRSQTVPHFKFWSMIIELELLMTRFVRSLREGYFPLCTIMRQTLHLVPRTGPYELCALAPCACP